jgi:site-specific recombinase XerD
MKPATFRVELKGTPNADGTRSVRVRITRNRLHAYLNTGIRIWVGKGRASEWNERREDRKANWIKGHREAAHYNGRIQETITALDRIAKGDITLSAKQIKERFEHPGEAKDPERRFLAFLEVWIARKYALGKAATADTYEYTRDKLKAFAGRRDRDADILTPSFLSAFMADWLVTRKRSSSTLKLMFAHLSTVYKHGILEGAVPHMGNPFATLEVVVPQKKLERPIEEQVLRLMELELPKGSPLEKARDCFLLQYALHGARISEAVFLEWADVSETHVTYLPVKRAKKKKVVPMNPLLRWVLDRQERTGRLVLPILSEEDLRLEGEALYRRAKSAKINLNAYLKEIGRRAGMGIALSSHMARHAFTDKALEKVGDNLRLVQGLLGHNSITSTEHYANHLRQERIDAASLSIYGDASG